MTRIRTVVRALGQIIRRRRRLTLALGGMSAGVVAAAIWLRCGPLPAGLLEDAIQPSTVVLDRQGERLYEARAATGLRNNVLDAHALPPTLVHATVAAEDHRFQSHVGVDPLAVARAMLRNLRAGHVVEGGSTISQQVAKLLIARQHGGARARGWRAKLYEAMVALRLEHRLTKDQILALYLNHAPYGNQIEGAERASQAYFGRGTATLTAAESAFLAALPQQPSRFNPWRAPARAANRQARILSTMAARGWLSPTDLAVARAERLTLTRESTALVAPHFVAYAITEASGTPHRIDTTLDGRLQRVVQGIIAAEREGLDRHDAHNVAIGVLDNHTGEWLAWEGSGDYFDAAHGGAIDGMRTPRQPGSALKPFTYAAAFERGITPARVLADVPSQFPTAEPGILYSPRNYDGRYRGPMLVRSALAGSENVPAVALASEIGIPAVARLLRRVGVTTLDRNAAHYGLGLTLGNAEVRLDELITAYATFARGGVFVPSHAIRAVDGHRPAATEAPSERVLSDQTAFWITDILADDAARAFIFGRGGSLEFPFPVAAKTGTSQSYFDNWVVGYTRDVTVGVWVGNFDRTPLRGSSGVTGAGPIFHAVMLAAVEHARGLVPIDDMTPIIAAPSTVVRRELCAASGLVAGDACPTRVSEWVPASVAVDRCTWHHASDEGVITIWPDVFQHWAEAQGLVTQSQGRLVAGHGPTAAVLRPQLDQQPAASVTRSAAAAASGPKPVASGRDSLEIIRPVGGALYLLDTTLRPEFQMLTFAARGTQGTLEWFVDGASIGRGEGSHGVKWPLARGRHTVVVRDVSGRSAETFIDVR